MFLTLKPGVRALGFSTPARCISKPLWLSGVVFALATGLPAQSNGPEANQATGIELLLQEVVVEPKYDSEDLVKALVRLGPRGYDQLAELLNGSLGEMHLDRSGRALLESARAGIPAHVAKRMKGNLASGRRLELEGKLALRVLGDHGTADNVTDVLAFMSPRSKNSSAYGRIGTAAADSLSVLLANDPRSMDILRLHYDTAEQATKRLVLQAVGNHPGKASIAFLANQLEGDPQFKLIVIAQLGRVAELTGAQPSDRAITQLLRELGSPEPALQREACLALGRLENHEAVGELIELLGGEHRGVANAAHWALERIGGTRIAPDVDRWRRWWEGELSWWGGPAELLIQDLNSGGPAAVSAALRKLGPHRLYRHELTREVLHLLDSNQVTLVAQTCAVLEALRSTVAREALERVVGDENPSTSPFAQRALDRLGR